MSDSIELNQAEEERLLATDEEDYGGIHKTDKRCNNEPVGSQTIITASRTNGQLSSRKFIMLHCTSLKISLARN